MELLLKPSMINFETIHDVSAVVSRDDFSIRSAKAKWSDDPVHRITFRFRPDQFHEVNNLFNLVSGPKEPVLIPIYERGLSLVQPLLSGSTLAFIAGGTIGSAVFFLEGEVGEFRKVEQQVGQMVYLNFGVTTSFSTQCEVFRAIDAKISGQMITRHQAAAFGETEVTFVEYKGGS